MKIIQKICDGMSLVSEWSAKLVMWLVLVLIVSIVYEVIVRYVFNSPTSWSFVLSYMLGAIIVAMGLAYIHSIDFNVRIDVIYARFSPRGKLIVDLFFTLFYFFPLAFLLIKVFSQGALFAYSVKEKAFESTWYPVTWPYKSILTLGFILLLLQGIATFVKDIMSLVKGTKQPW